MCVSFLQTFPPRLPPITISSLLVHFTPFGSRRAPPPIFVTNTFVFPDLFTILPLMTSPANYYPCTSKFLSPVLSHLTRPPPLLLHKTVFHLSLHIPSNLVSTTPPYGHPTCSQILQFFFPHPHAPNQKSPCSIFRPQIISALPPRVTFNNGFVRDCYAYSLTFP